MQNPIRFHSAWLSQGQGALPLGLEAGAGCGRGGWELRGLLGHLLDAESPLLMSQQDEDCSGDDVEKMRQTARRLFTRLQEAEKCHQLEKKDLEVSASGTSPFRMGFELVWFHFGSHRQLSHQPALFHPCSAVPWLLPSRVQCHCSFCPLPWDGSGHRGCATVTKWLLSPPHDSCPLPSSAGTAAMLCGPSGCVPVTSQLPSCPTDQTGPRSSGSALKLVERLWGHGLEQRPHPPAQGHQW